MVVFVARRLLNVIPLLLGVSALTFGVIQLAPGDFLDEMRLNPIVSEQLIAQMRAQFGVDQPVHVQYLKWLRSMVRLDFGYSFTWNAPVSWLIGTRLLNTLILGVSALVFSWAVAIPIGIYSATRQYSLGDSVFSVVAFLGVSIPNFFLALLLLLLAARTGWLPVGSMTSIEFAFFTPWQKVLDVARHAIIPTVVLGTAGMAFLMRQTRAQMLEVLRQEYVKTARAKGLAEHVVIVRHAFRNAVNPLITILGFELGAILSGAALTETVVGWPGLGSLILDAVIRRDVYLVMAALMIGTFLLIIGNLVADLLLALSDPRIRYD